MDAAFGARQVAARPGVTQRLLAFGALLALYLAALELGAVSTRGYHNASGAVDLGHYLVPSLRALVGERRAADKCWVAAPGPQGRLPPLARARLVVRVRHALCPCRRRQRAP